MSIDYPQLFRNDPLTERKTFLAFIEDLANLPQAAPLPGVPSSKSRAHTRWPSDTSLLYTNICHMDGINEAHGRIHGDSVIRWLGILLAEECGPAVYRLIGSEFAAILNSGTFAEHEACLQRLLKRVEKDAQSMGMSDPPIQTVLIHYPQDALSGPANVMMQISEAMLMVKNSPQTACKIVLAEDLGATAHLRDSGPAKSAADLIDQMHWIALKNAQHTLWMISKLDEVQQEAYTDITSGLPNINAALLHLEKAPETAAATQSEFSILLIDSDNFRLYNTINYATGDKAIRDLGAVYKQNLRPNDFVARWRKGDEFIIVLPFTGTESARMVAERFRKAVKEASQTWIFPTSISIGIATYPTHAQAINDLVDQAEAALKFAKSQGKDRAILATEVNQSINTELQSELEERKRIQTDLEELATRDRLTSLFNRRCFLEKSEHEFGRAIRYQRPLAMIMLDLDHFQRINDTYSYTVGDQVLAVVGKRLAGSVRYIDIVGRMAGEEFALVLPEMTLDGACQVAERLCKSFSDETLLIGAYTIHVSVSIGVSIYTPGDPKGTPSLYTLMQQAEKALERAKNAGRNQVQVFSSQARE